MATNGDERLTHSSDKTKPLATELGAECDIMIRYAMKTGLTLPSSAVEALQILADCRGSSIGAATSDTLHLDCDSVKKLVLAHGELCKLVAPATPRTLMHIKEKYWNAEGFWKFLGPIRLVAPIVGFALAFLLLFISLSILLNEYPDDKRWTFHLQLLCAAGVGGSFSALFEASRYIVNSTFDPRYNGYYWTKIVLGLTAGYILAKLIHIGPGTDGASLAPATLALLGGFSGTAVYKILKRLSETLESMVQGDPQAGVAAQQATTQAQAAEEVGRTRMKQASGLVEIKNLLATNANPEDIQSRLSQMLADLGIAPGSPSPSDNKTRSNGASSTAATGGSPPDSAAQAEKAQETPVN